MTRRYIPSRREGWRRFVDEPPRTRPVRRSRQQLDETGEQDKADYDETRHDWHANLPIVKTTEYQRVYRAIHRIIDSSRQDSDRLAPCPALDALPGLGKSTILNNFARDLDRRRMARLGPVTDQGHDRVPVVRINLTSSTNVRSLNAKICEFYGHPAARRRSSNADLLINIAMDLAISCGTELVVIDDVHFVEPRSQDGSDVINHFKFLGTEFPANFLFAGVGLYEKGFFSEGKTGAAAKRAQTGRRWIPLGLMPFHVRDSEGKAEWERILKSIEQQIVLADARRGMLVSLAGYIFERTTGHMQSLFSLITQGCYEAIVSGKEVITRDLLETVPIDGAAELACGELQAALATGIWPMPDQPGWPSSAAA